jgi:hypothetical protein
MGIARNHRFNDLRTLWPGVFTVLGQHRGVRRGGFAELSLWRADGSMRIVRAIPPVFTSRATSSKRMDSRDLNLMTSIAESAKCDLSLRNERLKRGTKLEETVKSYRQDFRA